MVQPLLLIGRWTAPTDIVTSNKQTDPNQVVLLGQNVNSYHDKSAAALAGSAELPSGGQYQVAEGFSNLFRSRGGQGIYFVDLLDQVRVRWRERKERDSGRLGLFTVFV
jgi:hypothetical protein